MDKKFLKKIIAQSSDDLQVISACCSEAKVYTSGIKYLSSNKIFLLSLFRFDKENEASKESINSIIEQKQKKEHIATSTIYGSNKPYYFSQQSHSIFNTDK